MQILHYHNQFKGSVVHQMTADFGESNTDKTYFRPDVSLARASLASQVGSDKVGVYDFPDGKDTGDTIQTLLRSQGLDKTEVDRIGAMIQSTIDNKKELDKTKLEKELSKTKSKNVDKMIENIMQGVSKLSGDSAEPVTSTTAKS